MAAPVGVVVGLAGCASMTPAAGPLNRAAPRATQTRNIIGLFGWVIMESPTGERCG